MNQQSDTVGCHVARHEFQAVQTTVASLQLTYYRRWILINLHIPSMNTDWWVTELHLRL